MSFHESICYLTDESGYQEQHEDAVVVSSVSQERLRHERRQQRHLTVGLIHLHLAELHLDGLNTHKHTPVAPIAVRLMVQVETQANGTLA